MEPRLYPVPQHAERAGLDYLGHYGGFDLYGANDMAMVCGPPPGGGVARSYGVVPKTAVWVAAPHRLPAYQEAFRRLSIPKKRRTYAEVVALDLEDWK